MKLRDDSRRLVAGLQARYAAETGIASLKIRHNNVLGYHIDIRPTHAPKMGAGLHPSPDLGLVDALFDGRAGELESKIASAADKALALEMKLFEELVAEALGQRAARSRVAPRPSPRSMSPRRSPSSRWPSAISGRRSTTASAFAIRQGRHPVVEQALRRAGGPSFVANDCDLAERSASGC